MSGPTRTLGLVGGTLGLVGGAEWTTACTFDRGLLEAAGGGPVTILATAAAYENPAEVVARAKAYFAELGAATVTIDVYDRAGAQDPAAVAQVADARFVYLASGSAMHLLSVLKRSTLWNAIGEVMTRGGVVAAAGSSASVLCDAMVDPRGGGFGIGLGLIEGVALIPRYDQWSIEKARRTIDLAPGALVLAGIPEATALIRRPDGSWSAEGAGEVRLFRNRQQVALSELP